MTELDTLKALLDERGVEWENDCHGMPWWKAGDSRAYLYALGVGLGHAVVMFPVTPQQAIDATLGPEHTFTREDVEGAFVSGYSLGTLPVGSDPQWDENRQTVDEHMAELGWVRADATLGPAATDGILHIRCAELPERIEVTLPDERGREVYSAKVYTFERRGECMMKESNWPVSGGYDDGYFEFCSACGFGIYMRRTWSPTNFCPNCGAKVAS